MSQPPPPGWTPPGEPAPGPAQPGWVPPVQKPGVVALRPLGLGDVFDGAFTTIRRNPGAMVGLSAAVLAAAMLVPAVVALVLAGQGSLDVGGGGLGPGDGTGSSFGIVSVVPYAGALVAGVVGVVLNGLLVRVVSGAVLGRRTSAGEAWRTTRRRLPRLLLLALVGAVALLVLAAVPVAAGVAVGLDAGVLPGVLVGVPLLLLAVAAAVWLYVRLLLLAPPALVLEGAGVLGSLRRARELSRGQFWRILGTGLLARVVAGVVSQVVGFAFGIVGLLALLAVGGTGGGLMYVFSQLLAQVLVGAVSTPFTSAVTALQYVDQRIRKEGLDVSLISAAGTRSPGVRL